MKKLYIFFILLTAAVLLCGCSASEKTPSENTEFTQSEEENSTYLQNKAYIESCKPLSVFADENSITALLYDENTQKTILARINNQTAVFKEDGFSAACKTAQADNATAVIDYSKNKTVKFYDNSSLTKTFEYDLSPYYENSVLKSFTGNDIIAAQDFAVAFFVDTNEKEYIYYLQSQDNKARLIYEFDRLNPADNEISHIAHLLCLTDDKLYFEGAISESGMTSDNAALAYINIRNGEITEITRERAVSFYATGHTVYSQDYQLNSDDTGSGNIFIYNTESGASHTVKTENSSESLNCKASADGKYLCTVQNSADKSVIKIYDIKSGKAIDSTETTPDYMADMLCIDSENRIVYLPNSNNSDFKNTEKFSF